jgi:hypothetical protein
MSVHQKQELGSADVIWSCRATHKIPGTRAKKVYDIFLPVKHRYKHFCSRRQHLIMHIPMLIVVSYPIHHPCLKISPEASTPFESPKFS